MKVLVHELLAIEQWKKEVYPMLAKDLLTQDTVKTYFIVSFSLLFHSRDALHVERRREFNVETNSCIMKPC